MQGSSKRQPYDILSSVKSPFVARTIVLIAVASALIACAFGRHQKAMQIADETYLNHWGNWEEVIRMSGEAIEVDPDYAWPYYQRGVAYSSLGQYNKALEDLSTAIGLNPRLEEAYLERARVLIRIEDFENVEIDLNAALSLTPKRIDTLLAMVELHSVLGETGPACKYLRKAAINGFSNFLYFQSKKNFKNLIDAECFKDFIEDFF